MQTDRVVIAGGLVLAWGEARPGMADIVLEGDSIAAIVPPGSAQAPQTIDAAGRLIIPGLINAHTHGHGGLAKGVGDRWSLELLLNAGPWINGGRTRGGPVSVHAAERGGNDPEGLHRLLRPVGDAAGAECRGACTMWRGRMRMSGCGR